VDVLSVPLPLSFGGCVACTFAPVFWWMCCLYFCPCLLVDVLSVLLTLSFGECVVCTFDLSTDNTSTKRQGQKYRQHIHQKTGAKVQTTHPLKEKVKSTNNDLQIITHKTKHKTFL
jgi:hypothetical protein